MVGKLGSYLRLKLVVPATQGSPDALGSALALLRKALGKVGVGDPFHSYPCLMITGTGLKDEEGSGAHLGKVGLVQIVKLNEKHGGLVGPYDIVVLAVGN